MALCWLGRCVLRGDGWDGLRAPCHRGDPNPGLVTPGGATDPPLLRPAVAADVAMLSRWQLGQGFGAQGLALPCTGHVDHVDAVAMRTGSIFRAPSVAKGTSQRAGNSSAFPFLTVELLAKAGDFPKCFVVCGFPSCSQGWAAGSCPTPLLCLQRVAGGQRDTCGDKQGSGGFAMATSWRSRGGHRASASSHGPRGDAPGGCSAAAPCLAGGDPAALCPRREALQVTLNDVAVRAAAAPSPRGQDQ